MSDKPKKLPRPVDTSRDYMTVKDVAAHLTVSTATIWRQVQTGTLPRPVKIGAATRWRRAEIEAALTKAA
jgi:predicted DNA-binding transcriptional regulator AlpA